MVRSGETGGALEGVLRRLSDYYEKRLDLQTKVRTALAYPIVMASVGIATIVILVTFVIPKMSAMFSDLGQALPVPTRILMWLSTNLIRYWWIFAAVIVACAILLTRALKSSAARARIDSLVLRIPIAGDLARKVEIARFSRTLATLLANGVPILESLGVVSATMGNAVMRLEMERAASAVREGSSLGRSLASSRTIPLSVTNMISIGEESGQLERSLLKVAETYERESDDAIKVMMSLLEPVMILTLGVVVGFIVISMLLPIFEINFLVR
jgi:general secretion pathway protein F